MLNSKMNDILLLLPNYFVSIQDMNNYFQTCKNLLNNTNNITYMTCLTDMMIKNNKFWYELTKHSMYINNTYYIIAVQKIYKNYTNILHLIPKYELLTKENYNINVYYKCGYLSTFLGTDNTRPLNKFDILYIKMIKILLRYKYGWTIAIGDNYNNNKKLSECCYNDLLHIYFND